MIKDLFAIFKNEPDLVFFDTAASAQKPHCVIDAMAYAMENYYANIHRGIYALSQKITLEYEDARKNIANFINAEENEVVFVRNATEGVNLVAQTWGKANLKKGDEVIISILEHHANIVPWQMLEKEIGIKIKVIPLISNGYELDFKAFKEMISDKTKLLAITGMSNAIGTPVDVKKYIDEAKKHGITTLVDGCQSIVHIAHDVKALDCDFFVFSGHKLYGPTGIGVLYGKYDILKKMPPYQTGGDMIKRVSLTEGTTFAEPPARFEAGTPATVEALGLSEAINFVKTHKFNEQSMTDRVIEVLQGIEGIEIIGSNQKGIVSFVADWASPEDIATLLDKQNIAVRVGHFCAMPLMDYLNKPSGLVRVSLGIYNSKYDVEKLKIALNKCLKIFK